MDIMLTVVLVAFFALVVTAMHLHLTRRPPVPLVLRTTDDINAEFFRIIEREGLRDLAM